MCWECKGTGRVGFMQNHLFVGMVTCPSCGGTKHDVSDLRKLMKTGQVNKAVNIYLSGNYGPQIPVPVEPEGSEFEDPESIEDPEWDEDLEAEEDADAEPPMNRRDTLINLAVAAATKQHPDAIFEDVSQSSEGNWDHWVARFSLEGDRYLLVEGQKSSVMSIRGPLGGRNRVTKSIKNLKKHGRRLSQEETNKADVIYRYEGEDALEEYIKTITTLSLDPED